LFFIGKRKGTGTYERNTVRGLPDNAGRAGAGVSAGKPGGRFIFAASDYLEKGTPRENVLAMLGAAKDEGRY
jgi:hypothetical protein